MLSMSTSRGYTQPGSQGTREPENKMARRAGGQRGNKSSALTANMSATAAENSSNKGYTAKKV